MPKRTNEFQKLIFLVKTHAAAGALVTESKMLRDSITGAHREVDICVESEVAGHHVVVSIECNARGRKAHVQWVEEMKAKHDRLPTNVLVLVSRAGFSKEALKLARAYGIQTLSLENISSETTRQMFGDASSLWTKVFRLTPTKVVFTVAASGDLEGEEVVTRADNSVFALDGTQVGSAKDIVELLMKAQPIIHGLGAEGRPEHKGFLVEWRPPQSDDQCLSLEKLEPKMLRRIELVRVFGECNFDVNEFRLRHGRLGDVAVVWAKGEFLGKQALLVASDAVGSGKKLSITTDLGVALKS